MFTGSGKVATTLEHRVYRIKKEVQRMEDRFVSLGLAKRTTVDKVNRNSRGPNIPIYQSSNPVSFVEVVGKLSLPENTKFADLGSGLGTICFAAAELGIFDHVVGFEFDPCLFAASRGLQFKLGISRGKLKFKRRSFLRADLSRFGVLHFFRPFQMDFEELMSKAFKNLLPGTVIISYAFPAGEIFPIRHYTSTRYSPLLSAPYYVYEKQS